MPGAFMINYHHYRNYWPLLALGRFRKLSNSREDHPKLDRRVNGTKS